MHPRLPSTCNATICLFFIPRNRYFVMSDVKVKVVAEAYISMVRVHTLLLTKKFHDQAFI